MYKFSAKYTNFPAKYEDPQKHQISNTKFFIRIRNIYLLIHQNPYTKSTKISIHCLQIQQKSFYPNTIFLYSYPTKYINFNTH